MSEPINEDASELWAELAEVSAKDSGQGTKEKILPQVFQAKRLSRWERFQVFVLSGAVSMGCVMGILLIACLVPNSVSFFEWLLLFFLVAAPALLSVDIFLRSVASFNPIRLVLMALGLQFAVPFWIALARAIFFSGYSAGGLVSRVVSNAWATYWFPLESWFVFSMTIVTVASFLVVLAARDRIPWYDEEPSKKKRVVFGLFFFLAPGAFYLFLLIVGQPSEGFAAWKREYSNSGLFASPFNEAGSQGPWGAYSRALFRVEGRPEQAELIARVEHLIGERDEKTEADVYQFVDLLEHLLEQPDLLTSPDPIAVQLLVTQSQLGGDTRPVFAYFEERLEQEDRSAEEFERLEESLTEALTQLADACEVAERRLIEEAFSQTQYFNDYSLRKPLSRLGVDPWELEKQRQLNALYLAWSKLKAEVDREELNTILAEPDSIPRSSKTGVLLHGFLDRFKSVERQGGSDLGKPRKTRQDIELLLVVSRLRLYQSRHGNYPETMSEIELPDSSTGGWELARPYAGRPGPQVVKLKYFDEEGLDREWTLPK